MKREQVSSEALKPLTSGTKYFNINPKVLLHIVLKGIPKMPCPRGKRELEKGGDLEWS